MEVPRMQAQRKISCEECGPRMRILGMELVSELFECGQQRSRGRTAHDPLLSYAFDFPEDLRKWMSEVELAHFVANAVERVRHEGGAGGRTRAWDMLLGILAYFYSTGLYVSDEVENVLCNNCNFDPVYASAFGNAPVSVVLRNFRRANRGAIEQCLAQVFQAAYSRSREPSSFGSRARTGTEEPSLDFYTEAKARLGRAIQADSWALDA